MRRSIEKTLLCLLLAAISVFGVELKWTAVGDVKRILTDGEHEGFRLSALGEAITAPMPPLDWLGVFQIGRAHV